MKKQGVAAFVLTMVAAAASHATYYYVDSIGGNDSNSGTQETDGQLHPWKTLARANSQNLQPGDGLLLRRNRVWHNETLNLRSTVHFHSYGSSPVLPVIKGSVPVGSLTWQSEGGQLYSANVAGLGLSKLSRLYLNGTALQRARHPNAGGGSYPVAGSRFFRSPGTGSGYQLKLEPGSVPQGEDILGAEIYIRILPWAVQRYAGTAQNGDVVTLQRDASYPSNWNFNFDQAGAGYRLENKRWMIDQPGEWAFDAAASKLYVWLPDGTSPAGKNLTASVRKGITGSNLTGFILQDIAVHETAGDAIALDGISNFQLIGLDVYGATGAGIAVRNSSNGSIQNSVIDQVSREGISTSDMSKPDGDGGNGSIGLTISGNKLSNIGRDDLAFGAISGGRENIIEDNVVENVGSMAIGVSRGSTISRNVIKGGCMDSFDCGAISMIGRSMEPGFDPGDPLDVTVSGNIIDGVPGSADGLWGTLGGTRRDTNGIYLDNWSTDVEVTGNLATGAGVGLLMSSTRNVLVADNAFVGNDDQQVQMMEIYGSTPFMHSNQLLRNILAGYDASTALVLKSDAGGNTADYATYDANKYLNDSNRFLFKVLDNFHYHQQMTFGQWAASSTSRDPQGSAELHGKVAVNAPGSSPLFTDAFNTNAITWWYQGVIAGWNFASGSDCPGGTGSCVRIYPAETPSWDTSKRSGYIRKQSANFEPGKRYRVTFDAKVDTGSGQMFLAIYHGESPRISDIAPAELTTSWQRFERILTRDSTASTSTWLQANFLAPAGAIVFLDNISAQEVVYQQPAASPFVTLYNGTDSQQTENCPSAKLTASCSAYVDAKTGTAVGFPLQLAPRSWKVLSVPTAASRDADVDGVPASADLCPSTPANAGVIATGCAVTY